jgi:hypothetical protein
MAAKKMMMKASATVVAGEPVSGLNEGDPKRMLVRLKAGTKRRSHTIQRPGAPATIEYGVSYVVEDEPLKERLLTTCELWGKPHCPSTNPYIIEEISQFDAVAEELAPKPDGLRFAANNPGSAMNPKRILPVAEIKRSQGMFSRAYEALADASASLKKAHEALAELERG